MVGLYFSINKFMNYINEIKPFKFEPPVIILWFKSDEAYINEAQQIVIKIDGISTRTPEKSIIFPHQAVIEIFNNKQPYVYFTCEEIKSIPQPKIGMSFISLVATPEEIDSKKFYLGRISFIPNQVIYHNFLVENEQEQF